MTLKFDFDKEMIERIRKTCPDKIAKDILSVQPMANNAIKELYDNAMSEQELIEQGYEPVSSLRIMWVKKPEPHEV